MVSICVLGLGYIGLPTASLFATNGFEVVGVDINQEIVSLINNGKIHIKEPGLNTLVQASVLSGKLIAKSEPVEADVFVITVPTPINADKGVDLSYVISATEAILPYLKVGNLVILESTSPPRTTSDIIAPILARSGLIVGEDVFLAYCPERVLPGNILDELINNNRIIGGINTKSALKAQEFYKYIVNGLVVITDATSAEMAKLMENTYRDVNIALANELTKIAYDLNLDALEIIKLADMHPRVNILQPGPGVGGHCLAVDPWFIVEKSRYSQLIKLSRTINDSMPSFVVDIVKELIDLADNPTVSVLGITYKGNVDDTRESPATDIIKELLKYDLSVKIYDPYVQEYKYSMSNDLNEAVVDSDLILILADHREFTQIKPDNFGELMRHKIIFDTRNCIDTEKWLKAGFNVKVLGRFN